MGKYFGLLIVVSSLVACKSPNRGSSVKDISFTTPMNFVHIRDQTFAMGETEVTRAQWKAVMGSYPEAVDRSWWKVLTGQGGCKPSVLRDDHPVSCVSFIQAQNFAAEMTERDLYYKYRLPSAEEWAAAAGDIEGAQYGWCHLQDGTQPVKKLKAHNGLYDMVGNVWEWTTEFMNPDLGPVAWGRVARGGSWYTSRGNCRATVEELMREEDRRGDLGFRLLREKR